MRRLAVAALVMVAGFFAGRAVLLHRLEKGLIHTHPQGPRTPQARGLAYDSIDVRSGDRVLRSFYVPADGPGLLIFHGNGEAISGWVDALKLLHDGGVAAMVFDYTGFGNSQGEPTLAHFHEDGLAAWHAFRTRLPAGTRACAYGLSLGTGVLLEVAGELDPPPDCVAISGAFLSLREVAVRRAAVPRWASFLLPDALDNLENAARLRAPLLIEHGAEDQMFPTTWAEKLAAAHPGARLEIVPGMRHPDPVAHPSAACWDPVIRFVKQPPATR
ncbi:MAG TPA: alpha/beta hydrolase [Myxococcales bacterium]|nr:alpha/beta hydrolase [Myxococcales bacterium]